MSRKALAIILTRLALVTGLLVVCCTIGLPLIAASQSIRPPMWAFIAPALGAMMALLLLVHRNEDIRRGGRIGRAANLPAQFVIVFSLVSSIAMVLGGVLEQDPLTRHRPVMVFLCGPALAIAMGQVLRALVQPSLMAELAHLASGEPRPAAADRRPLAGLGVLAIRPSLTLVAGSVVVVSLALVGGHVYSLANLNHEQGIRRALTDALEVVVAQTSSMAPSKLEAFLASYPQSREVTVIGLDRSSKISTARPGLPAGTRLDQIDAGRCQVAGQAFACLANIEHGVVVLTRNPEGTLHPVLSSLASDAGLLALCFFAFAALLGWAIGNDISRDFQVIANQLRAMAEQDRLDLGRPVTVTSIDEVGDLTEALGRLRTRLEQELAEHLKSLHTVREADRVKNEFFSDVSQELRTPLTTLCGYAQLLLDGSEGELSPTQQEDVRSIYHGGQQLLSLVNDVLDISVIESGNLQLSPEELDVGKLCQELVQAQSSVLEAQKRSDQVRLEIEVEAGLPVIQADPRRLMQVVQNLLSNALKFTSEGSITVAVRREAQPPGSIGIQVADTGVGIGQLDLPHVFESYRQVGDLTARRQGSGLGLAIAKHLVEMHGGTISVDSEVDRGSTFTVVLPVEVEA